MTCRLLAVAFLVSAALSTPAAAVPPWERVPLFRKVEADPGKSYTLTEDQGPWMIMAVTFSGDHAEAEARNLVLELRQKHKMTAYSHRMRFDYSKPLEGRGMNQYGEQPKMKYRRDEAFDEIAVLVGNFPSVDDPQAQKLLKKIKFLEPTCLQPKDGQTDSRPLAVLRMFQKQVNTDAIEDSFSSGSVQVENVQKGRGPMGHAFITTNPLLPDEYFRPSGVDKFILDLNEPLEYSLLKCRGMYSVQVATFTGEVILDQRKIREVNEGKDMPSRLAEAEEKAHKLTQALRKKGYEAYEFHDRSASIVTVGSFNSVGTPRADGKIEINPQVHTLMQTFGAERQAKPGQVAPAVGQPKTLAGLPFDIQPLPVKVPRRSLSKDYETTSLLPSR